MRNVLNEGSAVVFRTRFFDADDVAVTPTTARYRLRDLTNCRTIIDWTELVPAHSIDIPITATSNAIYSTCTGEQQNCLTVQANYATDNQFAEETHYVLRNLRGFT